MIDAVDDDPDDTIAASLRHARLSIIPVVPYAGQKLIQGQEAGVSVGMEREAAHRKWKSAWAAVHSPKG